ncbi:hypothetical protein GDO81_004618 [Engystomops pustulosus]|uniref:Uncharacterized protein n=1 Tax=Engystomops pustulosus TaxID=76066 RepID=A0AAV6ZTI7_ENGPU|nr:hypothetical protein GDO81_004618 [Engystomops pustulosus]
MLGQWWRTYGTAIRVHQTLNLPTSPRRHCSLPQSHFRGVLKFTWDRSSTIMSVTHTLSPGHIYSGDYVIASIYLRINSKIDINNKIEK